MEHGAKRMKSGDSKVSAIEKKHGRQWTNWVVIKDSIYLSNYVWGKHVAPQEKNISKGMQWGANCKSKDLFFKNILW